MQSIGHERWAASTERTRIEWIEWRALKKDLCVRRASSSNAKPVEG